MPELNNQDNGYIWRILVACLVENLAAICARSGSSATYLMQATAESVRLSILTQHGYFIAKRTWGNAEGVDPTAAQLLHHQPGPHQVDVAQLLECGRLPQQHFKLPHLQVQLLQGGQGLSGFAGG